jgi:RNA polymerase sigma-70 factor (ECF subfamily)
MTSLTRHDRRAACADTDLAAPALHDRLIALADGDRDALAACYAEHGDMVFRAAMRLTANRADAEDVTQELFIRLPRIVGGFAGVMSQFAPWLRRIAVRDALMRMRGGRRRREVSAESIASLVSASHDTLGRITLETALAALGAEHRTVFLLKEVEGYSHAEIAELLGITVANSEVRLHRARRQLREFLRGSR